MQIVHRCFGDEATSDSSYMHVHGFAWYPLIWTLACKIIHVAGMFRDNSRHHQFGASFVNTGRKWIMQPTANFQDLTNWHTESLHCRHGWLGSCHLALTRETKDVWFRSFSQFLLVEDLEDLMGGEGFVKSWKLVKRMDQFILLMEQILLPSWGW